MSNAEHGELEWFRSINSLFSNAEHN